MPILPPYPFIETHYKDSRQKNTLKQLRNQCQPLNFSDRLLRHMAPLCGEGVSDKIPILEKHTTSAGHTEVHILNTKAIHTKLKSGDPKRISNNMELALSTLRTTLILPINQEYRKLPKPITYKTKKYTQHGSHT